VHNGQASIAERVDELLEVVAELTDQFEVVIIDDGSSDATIEVATELSGQYPQVGVLRHGKALGPVAAIRSGLKRSCGEVVLIVDDHCCLALDDLRRLWSAMDEHELVLGRPGKKVIASSKRRLPELNRPQGGYQMVSRRAIGPLLRLMHDQGSPWADLAASDLRGREVEVGMRSPRSQGARSDAASVVQQPPRKPMPSRSANVPCRDVGKPRRPNFLARAGQFLREE
jgi:glycosyltransferase involved in cell wall biosynthesis